MHLLWGLTSWMVPRLRPDLTTRATLELPDRTSADFPGGPNEHDSPPPIFGYCFCVRALLSALALPLRLLGLPARATKSVQEVEVGILEELLDVE